MRGPNNGRPVRFTVRENDQAAGTFTRNQAGRKRDRAPKVATVWIDLLNEGAGTAEFFGQTFDARIAPVGDDADTVPLCPAAFEQLDNFQLALPAAFGHRS